MSDQDLAACYQLADVFVLPSTEPTEAFRLVQLEAISFGLPVVNTQLPTGMTSVSPGGVTGTSVPPGDPVALQRILSDADVRAEFGANARRRADEFSPEGMIQQLKAVYGLVMPR